MPISIERAELDDGPEKITPVVLFSIAYTKVDSKEWKGARYGTCLWPQTTAHWKRVTLATYRKNEHQGGNDS